ncbi:MAG: MFS transporter [Chloroflexi bacterium]|nr:MFS transporter [Chloroflexota bacterium]
MASAIDRAAPPRYRFAVEGSLLWLQVAMGLSFIAVAPLFPLIIDDYGIDNATVSLLIGAGSLAVAIATLPGSVFAARFGWRRATILGGVLMSSMALAPLADSFAVLLLLRLAFAVGAAIAIGSLPAAVMSWFPMRELPLVNGLNIVGQSIGITASVFTAAFLADLIGWRETLMAFGLTTLAGTVLFAIFARDRERAPGVPAQPPFSVAELRVVLRERSTLLLGLGVGGGVATFIAFNAWLPTYYQEEFGFSLERAGAMAAIPSFFGIVGSLLGSGLSVGLGRRRPLIIASGAVMPFAALATFVSESPLLLFPGLALFGMLSWLYFPSALTMPMELRGMTPERATVAVATMLSMGNVSGFFSPLLVGYLRDQTGSFVIGLTICALLPVTLLLAGLLLPETGPRGRRAAATSELA